MARSCKGKTKAVPTPSTAIIDNIETSLTMGKNYASQQVKGRNKWRQTVTLESDDPFSLTPLVIPSGVFIGRRVLLLDSELLSVDCFRILDLPPEIRNQIYSLVLVGGATDVTLTGIRESSLRPKWSRKWRENDRDRSELVTQPSLNILSTCRQVYNEASPVIYGSVTFGFSSSSTLLAFLTNAPVIHLRRVKVDKLVRSNFRAAGKLLGAAAQLEMLHVKLYSWHHPSPYYGLTGPRTMVHFFLKPFFSELYRAGMEKEKAVGVIRLDDLEGQCWKSAHTPGRKNDDCVCDTRRGEYENYMQLLRDFALECLEKEPKPKGKEDEDDYSYLTATPTAVARRDTGRPKRSAVTDKDISYVEH